MMTENEVDGGEERMNLTKERKGDNGEQRKCLGRNVTAGVMFDDGE